ncbi:MAG: hypothetical protein WCP87_01475 [Atribacterota bacterium]
MIENGGKLNRKMEVAIVELLAQPTIALAAEKAKVSQGTLYRWLNDPEFQAAFRKAKKEIVGHALTQVQKSVSRAVYTLLYQMENGVVESAKVSAAKAVLEFAIRVVEIEDLESRIDALEARVKS